MMRIFENNSPFFMYNVPVCRLSRDLGVFSVSEQELQIIFANSVSLYKCQNINLILSLKNASYECRD